MEREGQRCVSEYIPTRQSLLSRLKDWEDQASWRLFFETYWKLIYSTAIKAGLTDAEAQDVVQDTIISVSKSIPSFEYDPKKGSFKAWLLTLTRWRIVDQLRKRQKGIHISGPGSGTSRTSTVHRIPDPAPQKFEQDWDQEWEANLVEAALRRVKQKVDPQHFQIFDCHVLRQWPVSRVAKALNVGPGKVYLVKHRVNSLVKKEIMRLQQKPI
jgi:RNA polymerase sigma-70 factor (ECF subfamily)